MRVVIVGAGVTGLCLARSLVRRGVEPLVLDRAPAGVRPPARPFMLPYHAFDALDDAGAFERVRGAGWDIAPREDGRPVAIAVAFHRVLDLLAEGVDVVHDQEVVGLVREGERVRGLRVRDGEGEREVPSDLVVACDGVRSPLRDMAGIAADLSLAEGAHLSFISPAVIDRSFALHYQSDGRQVGLCGWPEGSAGWWDIERVGRDAALAPGLEAFRAAFARLLPPAAPALAALTSVDQLVYREIPQVRAERWSVPGLVLIGDAAHSVGPEAGLGAGLGLGDSLALAQAVAGAGGDPDRAVAEYELWRRPAVEPYLAIGSAGARIVRGGEKPAEERWPPPA